MGGRETVRQEFEHTVFRSLLLKKEKKKRYPHDSEKAYSLDRNDCAT